MVARALRSEGGARKQILAPPSLLGVYVAVVCSLGLGGVAIVIGVSPWASTLTQIPVWPSVFLGLAALVGEVKPIRLLHGDSRAGTLSTSAPFVLALVPVAGVGVAVLVQAIASVVDDVLRRREMKKSIFNTTQYSLSVLSARAVYCWLTHVPFFGGPVIVQAPELGPLLLAGIAMIGVNRILVAVVVSLSTTQTLSSLLREDSWHSLVTNLVLLSMGGIAADVATDGVGVLALLGAPAVGAYLMAAAAIRHAHDASHDSLTGLGNRGHLHRVIDQAFAGAQRSRRQGPGLVLLDLDHFKDINDTLGHPVGDKLLRQVAARLGDAVPSDALVHRLGGDEFAVVVRGNLADSRKVARDLLSSLDTPIRVENLELLVRASAGVAVAPLHGADGETLMKNADIALYHAKLERDRISTYSPEFDINTLERLQLLADLRTALETGQLHVSYQPQVDLSDLRTVGVEALVRWQHPRRGLVYPDDFIPLAENSGLIVPLTAFVLDTALGQLARWRTSGHEIRMAVNLSARHLSDLALPRQIAGALAKHQVPPAALVLEVTETGILSDPARADRVIRSLRGLGVAIAIDDYGTGNASLSYLKRLDVDELKIDKSFVSDIGSDNHDLIIVRSTIELALALGLRVVAEGIEDESTALALRELGSVIGQGYHLGRPATPEQIQVRLDSERRPAAAGHSASL